MKTFKSLILFHLIFVVVATAIISAWTSTHCALSFFIGSSLVLLNWIVLGSQWSTILGKKPIALVRGLIVIKYPLFAAGILFFVSQPWASIPWFAVGVGTVIPAGFWATVRRDEDNLN